MLVYRLYVTRWTRGINLGVNLHGRLFLVSALSVGFEHSSLLSTREYLESFKISNAACVHVHVVGLLWVCFRKPEKGCHGQGKVLENENCSRSGKSQGISFSVREI